MSAGVACDGSAPEVVLYGRPGCHLCEAALAVLLTVQARAPFALVQRNIELDERLLSSYLERIPVVTIGGRESFELFVDERAFEQALRESCVVSPKSARGRQ